MPDVMGLAQELVNRVGAEPGTWFKGGAPIGLIMLVLTFVAVIAVYAAMGVAIVAVEVGGDDSLFLPMMLGATAVVLVPLLLLQVAMLPLHASLMRSTLDHLDGTAPLGFDAPFRHARDGAGRVIAYGLLHMAVGGVAMAACYLPALVWLVLTDFAWCRVVLEGERPVQAIRWSVAHVRDNAGWHAGYVLLLIAQFAVFSNVPLLGPFLTVTMGTAWRTYAYARATGRIDGSLLSAA